MIPLKVLIACEESQAICKEFRALGHEAWSCDLQECSGGHPEWHIQGDAIEALHSRKWDLVIAHPPCTYLSNAGACWLFRGHKLNEERYAKGLEGKEFFMQFYNYDGVIAIENPIPSKIYDMPKPSQIVQPYEYGHPWSKKTCLWLKGLPNLVPTDIVPKEEVKPYMLSGSYRRTHDPKYKGFSRAGGSSRSRSKTFPGIAKAIAKQWSEYLLNINN